MPSAPIAASQNALNPRSYPLLPLSPESGLCHCHLPEATGTGNARRLDERHESATIWKETWIRRLRRSLGKYFPVVCGRVYSLVSLEIAVTQLIPPLIGIRLEKSPTHRLSRLLAGFRSGMGV